MKIGAIIFSRMSSGRLPGKAMLDISGKTLLNRVIERTKSIKLIDHICIATSTNIEDDVIESTAEFLGIDVFRGDLNDVAGRAISAADYYGYDHFLRVCGDRPFLDGEIYDNLISIHLKNENDLTTNIFPRSVPPGLTGEVIKVEALKNILNLTTNREDREHVTRYFYQNPSKFIIKNVDSYSFKNINELRLVIDNEADMNRAKWIINNTNDFDCKFNTQEIIYQAKIWEEKNNNKT